VIELIEKKFGTRKLSELGGIAQKAPALSILLVIVALANISLPLTNAFVGEFLMLNGIWNTISSYKIVFAVVAGLSIILGAVDTLNMIQKVFYGNTSTVTETGKDIRLNEKFILSVIAVGILVIGVYPQPLLNLTEGFVDTILKEADPGDFLKK